MRLKPAPSPNLNLKETHRAPELKQPLATSLTHTHPPRASESRYGTVWSRGHLSCANWSALRSSGKALKGPWQFV